MKADASSYTGRMSESLWQIKKHRIPASHIRGSDRGVRDNGTPWLQLAVNQYTPRNPPVDCNGHFSFVIAGGTASAKECYEPFFDELLNAGTPIRGIWIMDHASYAESWTLNQHLYGDEVHWTDASRDIWAVIHHFQRELPPPLVGIGQSLWTGHLTLLSTWHPRLFEGIIMMEPAMGPMKASSWPLPPKYFPGVVAARRKTRWPSRAAAATALRKTPYYSAFDPRVFDRVIEHELRPETDQTDGAVTLVTPRQIESAHWMLPHPPFAYHIPIPEAQEKDLDPGRDLPIPGFHRADAQAFYRALPHVHPPVLMLFGSKSPLTPLEKRNFYLETTGSGFAGSGGVAAGAVGQVEVKDAGHMVPFEKPREAAMMVATWLRDLQAKLEERERQRRNQLPFVDDVHPEILDRINKL